MIVEERQTAVDHVDDPLGDQLDCEVGCVTALVMCKSFAQHGLRRRVVVSTGAVVHHLGGLLRGVADENRYSLPAAPNLALMRSITPLYCWTSIDRIQAFGLSIYWIFRTKSVDQMARQCEVCGKRVQMGNRIETRGKAKYLGGVGTKITGISRRKFVPNLQRVKVSLTTGENKSIRCCTQCIRSGSIRKVVKVKPFELESKTKTKK